MIVFYLSNCKKESDKARSTSRFPLFQNKLRYVVDLIDESMFTVSIEYLAGFILILSHSIFYKPNA
jgi:hypothetical protein